MSAQDANETFLDADPEIPGQKFCLLSFLSPEKVLADKNIFMFEKFLQTYEFASRTKNLEAYLMATAGKFNEQLDKEADNLAAQDLSGASEICRKSRIRLDLLMNEFHEFTKKNERELRESKLKEAFDEFMSKNKDKLEDDFFAKNEFRTTVRGLKIRGVYGSQGEAMARCKKMQRSDPLHNIFMAEVGKWLPWDPAASEVAEQEYAEDQLNTLMKKYKENEEQREAFHREQRERAKAGGAKKSGGPTMQVLSSSDSLGADVNAVSGITESGNEDMFGSTGYADLAMARRMERQNTLENLEEKGSSSSGSDAS